MSDSDSDSLFVGSSSEANSEDWGPEKVIHDAFLERLEFHQSIISMDFDLWMKQVIIIMLNTGRQKEWPVEDLHKAIDTAARRHYSLPSRQKSTLIDPPEVDEPDDPNKYELVFTRRELKACANLIENVNLAGSRRKGTQNRLYSLFRHKVLGQDAINLKAALRRRRVEKDKLKKRQEARDKSLAEKNQALATHSALPSVEFVSRGSKRRHDTTDDEDADSLDGVEILNDDELQGRRGDRCLDDSDDIQSEEDSNRIMDPQTQPAGRPKVPSCFRVQTAKDRRKMQPELSPADRIAHLVRENEKLQKRIRKLTDRVGVHKRARLSAEIARDKAVQAEVRAKDELASRELRIGKVQTELDRRARALAQEESHLQSLNSKVTKDF